MKKPKPYTRVEEWVEEGQHIRRRIEGSTWALGDWLNRGAEWDRGFKRSMAITGYAASTLWNASRVAKAFPIEDRKVNLSFTTHREIMREEDPEARKALLARACDERWTPDDVTRYFQENRTEARPAPADKTYQHVQVKCPQCAHVFEVRGHKVARSA